MNYFHSPMLGDELQTFKIISSSSRENLGEHLTVLRRRYVKLQSRATAKHRFKRLVFSPANKKLIDFLNELRKLAKDAFGVAAQAILQQFKYAKKKSKSRAHLKKAPMNRLCRILKQS